MTRRPDPTQLAVLAIAGAFLAASTWVIPLLPLHLHRVDDPCTGFWQSLWVDRLAILVMTVPFVGGIGPMMCAERRLKRGFLNEVWSEEELDRARALLALRLWTQASVLVFFGCLFVVVTKEHGHNAIAYFYLLLMPTQTVYRMSRTIARPVVNTGGMKDWRSFQPIRSEHWGEAPGGEQLPS